MVRIPKFKKSNKQQGHVDRPEVITGNFELHYEEVVHNNRFIIVAFALTGLLAVAAFIPSAVYESTADSQRVSVEVETGKVANPNQVMIVKGDSTAASDGYIEFK